MSINATLFVQAIVFLILVWFTMKFVWPPITKALDERAQKIADGLAAADKAKAELSSANKRVEAELASSRNETAGRLADAEAAQRAAEERTAFIESEQAKLRSESSSIREEARSEGAAILAEMKAQAAAEAERLQQTVKSSLEAEREVAQRVLRAEIGELAIELASRIVGQKLQEDAVANKVVDDFIAELEGKRA